MLSTKGARKRHWLKGRADIRYVQQIGHRSISTTEKYMKIEITDLNEVYEHYNPREQEEWGEEKMIDTVLKY